MTIESATYIADLNVLYPAAGDSKSEGDDHLRLIKTVLKNAYAKTASGATQLPGGLILQWAFGSSVTLSDSLTQAITLPVTFPTSNLFALVGMRMDSHAAGHYTAHVSVKSVSSVTAYFTGTGAAESGTPLVIAIGY